VEIRIENVLSVSPVSHRYIISLCLHKMPIAEK
jgi:hypothetical protein